MAILKTVSKLFLDTYANENQRHSPTKAKEEAVRKYAEKACGKMAKIGREVWNEKFRQSKKQPTTSRASGTKAN